MAETATTGHVTEMSEPGDGALSDRDLVRHMHGLCSQYHMHFSTVRTASTALFVPIGFAVSVSLLDTERVADLEKFPYLFFVLLAVLVFVLNMQFSVFSKRCRQIERYLERELAAGTAFDPAKHGFRHLFWCKDNTAEGLGPRPRYFELESWWDVFMTSTLIGAGLYLILFVGMYSALRP